MGSLSGCRSAGEPGFCCRAGHGGCGHHSTRIIQILDYKTDQVSGPLLEERIKGYHLQLRLYAEALQRVYRKPVTHLWLHLLATQETRTVATHSLDKDVV